MQLLPRHFHLQSPVSGFSIPHFLGQYDIPKHEAINWKRVTENANNMGTLRHKMIKIPVDTHLAGRSFPKSLLSWVSLQMFSLHSYFPVKFGAALSSHITRSSAGGRYGSYSMQKLLRKLQGARLYGSRDARLNFLLSQVGSPPEAKCVLFMPRLLASAYRTHNLLWCVELYAEIDPASFANSGGWWFHTQLSV